MPTPNARSALKRGQRVLARAGDPRRDPPPAPSVPGGVRGFFFFRAPSPCRDRAQPLPIERARARGEGWPRGAGRVRA